MRRCSFARRRCSACCSYTVCSMTPSSACSGTPPTKSAAVASSAVALLVELLASPKCPPHIPTAILDALSAECTNFLSAELAGVSGGAHPTHAEHPPAATAPVHLACTRLVCVPIHPALLPHTQTRPFLSRPVQSDASASTPRPRICSPFPQPIQSPVPATVAPARRPAILRCPCCAAHCQARATLHTAIGGARRPPASPRILPRAAGFGI